MVWRPEPEAQKHHIRLLFSEWPLAPDASEHSMFEGPMVLDRFGHFSQVQGFRPDKMIQCLSHKPADKRKQNHAEGPSADVMDRMIRIGSVAFVRA